MTPRNAARSGSRSASSSTAAPGRVRWAGPTSTRSRRRWVNEPWRNWPPRRTCRCRSCGLRSSSPPTRTRSRAGSTASRWPTRSSVPTGWGRSPSSPASPRASSTSSRSTSSSTRSWRSPRTRRPPVRPSTTTSAPGARNPVRFFELYEWIRGYFEEHPLPERGRGEHKVPDWKFPGNLTVERMLRRAERLTDVAEQVVTHMPKSKVDAGLGATGGPRQGPGRLREALQRPVRHVHRDRGRLHRRSHVRVVRVAERRGQGDVPVRRRHGRLEVLPEGRAFAGGDPEPARTQHARPANVPP